MTRKRFPLLVLYLCKLSRPTEYRRKKTLWIYYICFSIGSWLGIITFNKYILQYSMTAKIMYNTYIFFKTGFRNLGIIRFDRRQMSVWINQGGVSSWREVVQYTFIHRYAILHLLLICMCLWLSICNLYITLSLYALQTVHDAIGWKM